MFGRPTASKRFNIAKFRQTLKVLTNTASDSFGTADVTVAGSKIVADGLSAAEWEARETSSGSGLIGLYNGENVLKVNASATPKITTSGTGYNAGGFGYTANNHISYPYAGTDYYIGASNSQIFKAAASESELSGKVYLFVKGDDTTGGDNTDEPTPGADVTYVKTTGIEAGQEYLIVAKSSGSSKYYALQNADNQKFDITGNVAADEGKITLPASAAEKLLWTTSSAATSAKGSFIFTNSGESLYRVSQTDVVGFGTAVADSHYGMTYGSSTIYNVSSNGSNYYLGYGEPSGGGSYTFRFATTATDNISFYVKSPSTDPSTPDDSIPVTGIALDKTALSVTVGADTRALHATVVPDNATNKAVTWSSSNPSVATVDGSGNITFMAAGTATITAASAENTSIKATCTITVESASAPVPGDNRYLIISNGYALSSKETGSYSTDGGNYSGFKGVPYTEGVTPVTDDMLWEISINDHTYTIKQGSKFLKGSYLPRTAQSSMATAALELVDGSAVWTYSSDGSLKSDDAYLSHSDGTAGVSGSPNVFSMRSNDNRGTIEFVKYTNGSVTPSTPDGDVTYVRTDAPFEAGKEYLFVGMSGSSDRGYLLANNNNSTTDQKFAVEPKPGDTITLSADIAKNVSWKAIQSGEMFSFSCDGKYLSKAANTSVQMANAAESFTVSGNRITSSGSTLCYGTNSVGGTYIFNFNTSTTDNSVPVLVYVKQAGSTEPTTPPVAPTGDVTYLAFTSDVHNKSDNQSANRLATWLNTVSGKLNNATFDKMGFCGDLGDASQYGDQFWANVQPVLDGVTPTNKVTGGYFAVAGNHEWMNGFFGSSTNSTARQYSKAGSSYVSDDYILYSMGATQQNEIYNETDIANLVNFLNSHSAFDKPIFILSHFPLHSYSGSGESSGVHDGKAAQGSAALIAALNKAAADNGQTIIYLWGHNHSSNNDHYDQIYTDKINNTPIQFTYAAAGCMSDSEYAGSNRVRGKGLVAAIYENCVTLTYYGLTGNLITEKQISFDSTTPSTPDDPTPGTTLVIGITLDKTALNVTVGDGMQALHATVQPANATNKGVNWSSSNPSVAAVDNNGRVTFKAAGTATITAASAENAGIKASCTITVKPASVPVTSSGYLIISNGYALSSNEIGSYTTSGGSRNGTYRGYKGVPYTEGVTPVTDDMLWDITFNDDGTCIIKQGDKVLVGSYQQEGNADAAGNLSLSDANSIWTYSNGNLQSGGGYLAHSDGTPGVSGSPNVFSMRSKDNRGSVELVPYNNPTPPVVTAPTLVGIAVTNAKTSYTEGENFDTTGMVVTATYSDDSTAVVTGYTVTPAGELTPSNTVVTVSYTEGEITKTAAVNITVAANQQPPVIEAPTLIGIAVTNAKTSYTEGEKFDTTGMVVTATYSDGSSAVVTGYSVEPSAALTQADKSVTISYTEGEITRTAVVSISVQKFIPIHTHTSDTSNTGDSVKVQSAKTADSGIVLYIGMSVVSLMGMGWVGKKKFF